MKCALLNTFSPKIFSIIFIRIDKNLEFSRFSDKCFNWGYNKALKCIVFYPKSCFGKRKRKSLANE